MKIKLIIISTGLIIASCNSTKNLNTSTSQELPKENFEGIIKYKFLMDDVSDLTGEQIEEKLQKSASMFGRHMTYYIKEPKMKTVMDGELMKLISYNDQTDSMYMHSPDLNELSKVSTYDNWSFKYDTIVTTKNAKIINGEDCDLLTFKSDKYEWKYYYNQQLKVDPENFKHYQSCFWNKAIEICNSLPVRFEGKIPGTYIYLEAEEILPQRIDEIEFKIPKK